jgi:NAD(P)-dependent dehydrogenase (short-subunit alcohol dehydrogenase family)
MAPNQGRVMLVTGAAGGVGLAICRQLAQSGATVIATDVNEDLGQANVHTLTAAGLPAEFAAIDVTEEASWQAVVERISHRLGRLDALVNCAGVVIVKSLEETTLSEWRKVMSVNLESIFLGTKAALPLMRATAVNTPQGGSIVNLSSISGIVGVPSMAAYGASKGGVRQLTKSMALDFARRGYRIRVNSVHPGLIDTEMAQRLFEGRVRTGVSRDIDEARKSWIDGYPIGRIGTPHDVAATVLFLVSDGSGFMTGSELTVDGGATAQ